MIGWSRFIVALCLAPGAAVTIYAMVGMYQAMGAGADVDEQKLRADMQLGFRWIVIGLVVAGVLLVLLALFRVLRPRRRQE